MPDNREAALGLIFGIGAVMAFIGPPIWGYISDRVGRRMPFLAIGGVLTAVALVWLAYAPSYAQLLLAYILLQAADDMASGPYAALIPDLTAKREHGVASGWLGTLQAAGSILGGMMGFVVASLQWQLLVVALLNLVAAALILSQIREVPGLKPQPGNFVSSVLAPWLNPDFRWVWATRFLMSLAQYIVQFYLQFYLADRVQTFSFFGTSIAESPAQAVSLLGLLIFLGAIVVSVWAGRASDQLGRKRVIYISGAGLAVLMAFILLIPRYEVLLLIAVVFGLFYGAYLAVSWALIADILPNPKAHATDMGVWQTSIVLPQILAGLMGGVLGSLNREGDASGYTVVFLIAAGCFVLATVLVRQIRGAR